MCANYSRIHITDVSVLYDQLMGSGVGLRRDFESWEGNQHISVLLGRILRFMCLFCACNMREHTPRTHIACFVYHRSVSVCVVRIK